MAEVMHSWPSPSDDGNQDNDFLEQSNTTSNVWLSFLSRNSLEFLSLNPKELAFMLEIQICFLISYYLITDPECTAFIVRCIAYLVRCYNKFKNWMVPKFTSEFDHYCIFMVLENLAKNNTRRSTLEILLILNYCVNNPCFQCRCCSTNLSFKIITLMNSILQFLITRTFEKIVKNLDSDCKSDYELHLSILLKIKLKKTMNYYRVRTASKQTNSLIDQIIFRRIGRYLKKWLQNRNEARVGLSAPITIPLQFFECYEEGARIGRLPHYLWQETPLRKKISNNVSLEAIFARGNEELCIVCYMDGEDFKNDFTIFLNCNHLLCSSCAAQILVDDTKPRCCPMCRKEILCWTTKKLVQLTTDGRPQRVKVSSDEMKKHERVSMNKLETLAEQTLDEQRQPEENSIQEQLQLEHVSKVTKTDATEIISNTTFYQLSRFDTSENFLYCLRCLHDAKTKLSCREIMLIILSNLPIFHCQEDVANLIEKSNTEDILQALQHLEHIVRYTFQKVQNARLTMSSLGFVDRAMVHQCFLKIRTTLETIELLFTDKFPNNSKDIQKQLFEIIKIGSEINHLLHQQTGIYDDLLCSNSVGPMIMQCSLCL